MGMQYVCDWCGKVRSKEDMRILHLIKPGEKEDKPDMQPHEICVFCKQKLLTKLLEIQKEVVMEGGEASGR